MNDHGRSRSSQTYQVTRRKVLAASGNRCAVCGTCNSLDAAHIRPRSVYGDDSEENLLALCATCHRYCDNHGLQSYLAEFYYAMKNNPYVNRDVCSDGNAREMLAELGRTAKYGMFSSPIIIRSITATLADPAVKGDFEYHTDVKMHLATIAKHRGHTKAARLLIGRLVDDAQHTLRSSQILVGAEYLLCGCEYIEGNIGRAARRLNRLAKELQDMDHRGPGLFGEIKTHTSRDLASTLGRLGYSAQARRAVEVAKLYADTANDARALGLAVHIDAEIVLSDIRCDVESVMTRLAESIQLLPAEELLGRVMVGNTRALCYVTAGDRAAARREIEYVLNECIKLGLNHEEMKGRAIAQGMGE